MTLTFIRNWLMAILFPKPERRKNRAADAPESTNTKMELCLRQNLRMRQTLARIASITKREIPDDDECRLEMQTIAHKAINDTGMIE